MRFKHVGTQVRLSPRLHAGLSVLSREREESLHRLIGAREHFTRFDFYHRVNACRQLWQERVGPTCAARTGTHTHPQSHMLIFCFLLGTLSNFLSSCCGLMQVRLDVILAICNEKTPVYTPSPSGRLDP